MEWEIIWKAALIVIIGTFLLRIAGRKTISQMTLAETIIMIAIGSLLIQPVAGRNIWQTFFVGGILIATLLLMEFLQVKSDVMEKWITGKSKVVVKGGKLQEDTMKKVRLTVDQLEMTLRQQNVSSLGDVEWATLEPNGQIGFVLKEEARPVTKKEFLQIMEALEKQVENSSGVGDTLFQEIEAPKRKDIPDRLN